MKGDEIMSDLKSCPFCGGKARKRHFNQFGDTEWLIECTNRQMYGCNASTSWRKKETDAIKDWNTRQPHPAIKEVYVYCKAIADRFGEDALLNNWKPMWKAIRKACENG